MLLLLGAFWCFFYDGTKAIKKKEKNESIAKRFERLGFMICKMVSIVRKQNFLQDHLASKLR